ncbi:MAG: hypothetical protein WCG80_07725 [Spirochaetales bacterium]
MSKVSEDARKKYLEIIKDYKKTIEDSETRESLILGVLEKDPTGAEYKRLRLADENLNLLSYFVLMNTLSVNLLGVKNEAYLNNARKLCYKVVIYLEQVVSNLIDVPFGDYEEKIALISSFDATQRWELINKMGFSIQLVMEGYGDNTKWKWTFVELEARFATVVKNLLNLKTLFRDMDPGAESYAVKMAHLALARKLLDQAANRYREKYELSTLRFDDFRLAIKYLGALRLLSIAINRSQDAEAIKKKMDIWTQKLENDLKRKDIADKQ